MRSKCIGSKQNERNTDIIKKLFFFIENYKARGQLQCSVAKLRGISF